MEVCTLKCYCEGYKNYSNHKKQCSKHAMHVLTNTHNGGMIHMIHTRTKFQPKIMLQWSFDFQFATQADRQSDSNRNNDSCSTTQKENTSRKEVQVTTCNLQNAYNIENTANYLCTEG